MNEFPETHQRGRLSVENTEMISKVNLEDCDVGIQVSWDGRIWLCLDGIAWLRFKPAKASTT